MVVLTVDPHTHDSAVTHIDRGVVDVAQVRQDVWAFLPLKFASQALQELPQVIVVVWVDRDELACGATVRLLRGGIEQTSPRWKELERHSTL
jgi:hypothetical protein